MHGDGEDDIAEHNGGPLRIPGWARRPRWLPAAGWRPSRGAAVLGTAGLIVGLFAGYALGYGRHARDGRPPGMTAGHAGPSAVPASPAPSGSPTQAGGFGAYAPAQGIAGFAGTVIDQTAGACSVQHGRELQLGVEVINLSGTTVTLGQVKPILPMGGLRALSQQWAPCDAISPSWLIAGGDGTVTIIRAAGQSGAPGMPPGATRLGDALQGEMSCRRAAPPGSASPSGARVLPEAAASAIQRQLPGEYAAGHRAAAGIPGPWEGLLHGVRGQLTTAGEGQSRRRCRRRTDERCALRAVGAPGFLLVRYRWSEVVCEVFTFGGDLRKRGLAGMLPTG